MHTALVRVAGDLVLVEGRWSNMGCYLHAPEGYLEGFGWTFYRSARPGHLLRGLDGADHTPGTPQQSI